MHRILLDEGVPIGVQRYLWGCSVESVAAIGWAGMTNGDLIAAAELAGFEILVTADQNLVYQQDLTRRRLALVVLDTNHWPTIQAAIGRVQQAVTSIAIGGYLAVPFDRPPLLRRAYTPKRDDPP